MEELVNQFVRVSLEGHTGMLSTSGQILRVEKTYILLKTSYGPLYIMSHVIRIILVIDGSHQDQGE